MRPPQIAPDRLPVVRYAILLFLLTAAIVATVAVTLVRNADRSSRQQSDTALAGGVRVGATSFGTLRSNLRVKASQLAASLDLQRALVTRDEARLEQIASDHHAQIRLPGITYGRLAAAAYRVQRDDRRPWACARDCFRCSSPRQRRPRRPAAGDATPGAFGLVLLHDGVVVAGGPAGTRPKLSSGRTVMAGVPFAVQRARLPVKGVSLLAVEPVSAIEATTKSYRRLVFLVAAITLALAGALATRLARPLAHVVGEVALLNRQAKTDALTGLANRRGLAERLDVELRRAQEQEQGRIRPRRHRRLQGRQRHARSSDGDKILRAVAKALGKSIRQLDLAARYGGEEFAIVLPGSGLAGARRLADRMRQLQSLRSSSRACPARP